MLRPILAAVLGAGFGAVAIDPLRERVADQLWQPIEATAVSLTALAAGLIAAFVMSCREPRRAVSAAPPLPVLHVGGHQPGRELQPGELVYLGPDENPVAYAHPTGEWRGVSRVDVKMHSAQTVTLRDPVTGRFTAKA